MLNPSQLLREITRPGCGFWRGFTEWQRLRMLGRVLFQSVKQRSQLASVLHRFNASCRKRTGELGFVYNALSCG
jgi:hypothetical protein